MGKTLCWDCKKAIGGCSWSAELEPVKGWTAENAYSQDGSFYTLCVKACPEFLRDSWGAGMYKTEEEYLKHGPGAACG